MMKSNPASNTDKVILFLHIPKSGGTTLKRCIQLGWVDYSKPDEKVERTSEHNPFFNDGIYYYPIGFFKDPIPSYLLPDEVENLQRKDLQSVIGHFSFGIHRHLSVPSSYVTFLRDPVERVMSLYYHLINTGVLKKSISLEEFVMDCPPSGWKAPLRSWYPVPDLPFDEADIRLASRTLVDNDQTRRISGLEPAWGQCGKEHLEKACQNLVEYFPVVGLTDRFDESLLLLSRQFNWKTKVVYIPQLVNSSRPAGKDIPDSVRSLIEEKNRWDRALFSFATELLEKRIKDQDDTFYSELEVFRRENEKFILSNQDLIRDSGIG